MSDLNTTFSFTGKASFPKNAIALIYDLEEFSRFFNQPDAQDYVPLFLNHVSKAVSVALFGGECFWGPRNPRERHVFPLDLRVVHQKFLGDGALYIFEPPKLEADFSPDTLSELCNRLWNLQQWFKPVIAKMSDEIPVLDVPTRIRFGLARGSIYELKTLTASREYIGVCINLASRLQRYCPSLAFIASARLRIPAATLEEHGYVNVVATRIKGFAKEKVIVDRDEFEGLDSNTRDQLFEGFPAARGTTAAAHGAPALPAWHSPPS